MKSRTSVLDYLSLKNINTEEKYLNRLAFPRQQRSVETIHATYRDLLLTGYAHVQTHSFYYYYFFFLQKVHFPVLMYKFPLKNAYYHMNICTVSQLNKNN